MNCGDDESPTFHISILGSQRFILNTKESWESLTQSVIMEYYLDTLKHLRPIESTTLEPQLWKKLSM